LDDVAKKVFRRAIQEASKHIWGLQFGVILAIKASMLILTRKSGETITIGEEIQIKVLAVQGGKVRLGIQAPREVAVNREEILLEQLQQDEKSEG